MQLDDILKLLRWGVFWGKLDGWNSAPSTYLRQLRPSTVLKSPSVETGSMMYSLVLVSKHAMFKFQTLMMSQMECAFALWRDAFPQHMWCILLVPGGVGTIYYYIYYFQATYKLFNTSKPYQLSTSFHSKKHLTQKHAPAIMNLSTPKKATQWTCSKAQMYEHVSYQRYFWRWSGFVYVSSLEGIIAILVESITTILLMEEIPHQLVCIKQCK